jgi:hypothetical protein
MVQYRVVLGECLNECHAWVDEEDMRMSMPGRPCEGSFEGMAAQAERAIIRVHQIRSSQLCSSGKEIFEYLVDENVTWIAEDHLRVSLSPEMISKFQGNFPSTRTQV